MYLALQTYRIVKPLLSWRMHLDSAVFWLCDLIPPKVNAITTAPCLLWFCHSQNNKNKSDKDPEDQLLGVIILGFLIFDFLVKEIR